MDAIVGMKPTGREISGPAFDLVEVESGKGLKHTAICYNEEFIEHPALLADLKEFGKFMENPGVSGLVELSGKDNAEGQYAYPTGTAWSVAEVIRAFADQGDTCGIRAGLELAYVASQILQEAEDRAARFDLFNHGSLSPWHILLKSDGQVQIIGYGFPQVEVLDFLEDESLMPKEDSFRYAPPERLADEGEDLSSDLFSLALIALELMTGRPVYDGLINDIRQQATRAEGAYRLYKWRNLVPEHVREALGRALKYDPDARYTNATDFVYAMHDLLGTPDIEGPSLLEVMKRLKHADQGQKPLIGGRTAALTKDDLARLAAELDEDDATEERPLPPPNRPRPGQDEEEEEEEEEVQRWGKVERPGRRTRATRERTGGRGARERAGRGRERSERAERPARSGRERASSRGGGDKQDLRERLRSGRSSTRSSGGGRDSRKDELRASLRQRLRDSVDKPPEDEPEDPIEEPIEEPEDEAPEDEPEEKDMAGDEEQETGAAALLARLRNSAGRKPASSPSTPSGGDPTATVASSRSAGTPSRPAAARPSATGATRSERTSRRDRSNDEKVVFEIEVEGHKPRRTKLRLGDPLAETADRLARAFAGIPTDLTGQLQGWFRLEQDGEWLPGHETADALDPDEPVVLAFVPNRVLPVRFDVKGIDPPGLFQALAGTAVPSASMVEHLADLLDLPEGDWGVYVDGERLEPQQILEDFEPGPGFQVVVKR